MDTDTVWTVTINSLAPGARAWQRRFLGKPIIHDIRDALEHEGKQPEGSVEVFADLASRLPVCFHEKAMNGRGYIIYAAQVEIGSVSLKEWEVYTR
jgi:hypothetical protein